MKNLYLKRFYFLLLFLMMGSFVVVNFIGPKTMRTNIIDGDGSGYYAYLPAVCIFGSVDFTPVFELEKSKRSLDYIGHYFHENSGILINKYTSGTALLQLPFFLLGWLCSIIFGLPADGYSVLFQYSVALSAVFWVFIGMLYLGRLLHTYKISVPVIFFLILCGLFATNLFHYTFIAPSMSHAYSFGLISIFIFYIRSFFLEYKSKSVWIASFLLGLIALVRPANLIILVAVPFLAGSMETFRENLVLKVRKFDYLKGALFFLIALSPQLIINYLQTGQLLVYGYEGEGFFFDRPEFIKFLTSFRKGWWIYTPFMILIIPAIFALIKRSAYLFYAALVAFLIIVYVLSSWWNWIYGDSFGMRPMIDFYPFFLLIIALFLDGIKNRGWQITLLAFGTVTLFLNLFQNHQYVKGIIHPDSMTREAYWYVFLKSDNNYKGVVADMDEYFYGRMDPKAFFESSLKLATPAPGWSLNRSVRKNPDGGQIILLDEKQVFSPTFDFKFMPHHRGMTNIYVRFDADYLEYELNAGRGVLFTVAINNPDGELRFYKTFKLKRLPSEQTGIWHSGTIGFKLPEINPDFEQVRFYLWNVGKQEIELRNLVLSFYTYNP